MQNMQTLAELQYYSLMPLPPPTEPRHFLAGSNSYGFSSKFNTQKEAEQWTMDKSTNNPRHDIFIYEAIKKFGPEKPIVKATVLSGYKEAASEADDEDDDF